MSESIDEHASSSRTASTSTDPPKRLPKGVVLGKDGKPCRSCTSVASWAAMIKAQTSSSSSPSITTTRNSTTTTTTTPPPPLAPPRSDCPPDVEELGRSTWTFLHALTATYPTSAPPTLQSKTRQFLSLFSELYPCWVCADDLRDWMAQPGNAPRVEGQDMFGFWMCRAHNAVNVKLGKEEFDCLRWKERWRDGWKDGSCD